MACKKNSPTLATSEAGTDYSCRAPEFTSVLVGFVLRDL